MKQKQKLGRPFGTKKDDSKTGVVRFVCDMEEKGDWCRKSRKAGMSLSAWIRGRLNS